LGDDDSRLRRTGFHRIHRKRPAPRRPRATFRRITISSKTPRFSASRSGVNFLPTAMSAKSVALTRSPRCPRIPLFAQSTQRIIGTLPKERACRSFCVGSFHVTPKRRPSSGSLRVNTSTDAITLGDRKVAEPHDAGQPCRRSTAEGAERPALTVTRNPEVGCVAMILSRGPVGFSKREHAARHRHAVREFDPGLEPLGARKAHHHPVGRKARDIGLDAHLRGEVARGLESEEMTVVAREPLVGLTP